MKLDPEKQKEKLDHVKSIKEKVKTILENEEEMKKIQAIRASEIDDLIEKGESSEKFKDYKEERLLALLKKAGIFGKDDREIKDIYEEALSINVAGYTIIHERDVDELFVNNYNKEWIINWNGNMDIQLCLDFFAVITYISDYYSKDDSGTIHFIKDALRQSENDSLKSKLSIVANTFLTHRQIGECEA